MNLKVQFLFVRGLVVVVLVVVDVVVLVVLVDVVVVDVVVVVFEVVVCTVVSRLVTNAELVVGGCVVEVVDVVTFGLVVDELLVPKSVGFFL